MLLGILTEKNLMTSSIISCRQISRQKGSYSILIRERYVGQSQSTLFTVVHHYNEAIDLIAAMPRDSEEHILVLSLNYEAAQKAKNSR